YGDHRDLHSFPTRRSSDLGQPLELLGHAPALVAIEAEDQGRRVARVAVPPGHEDELLGEELIGDPFVGERDLALLALDEGDLAAVAAVEPGDELAGVADGGGEEQQADVRGEEVEG